MKLARLLRRIALEHAEDMLLLEDPKIYLEKFIPDTLLKSNTLQQAFAITAYEMEEVYYEAYHQYQNNQIIDAANTFRWLAMFNPFVEKYWMGLGASLQLLEKYQKAVHAYGVAALLNCNDPLPHYHAYECYDQLGDQAQAKKAARLAFKRAVEKPEHTAVLQKVRDAI